MSASDWGGIAAIAALIGAAAVMAASEVAVTRMGRARAYHLAEDEQRGAASLLKVVENPAPFLNVILLLTLVFHLGGTTIATVIAARNIGTLGEVIATASMTFLLFVLAEVTPKTFGVLHTDRVALRLAPLIYGLGTVFGPVARGLIGISNVLLPGRGLKEGPFVTEADIKAMAEMASEEEAIEEGEAELIHSIFEFGDTIVREVMIPKPDMVTVESSEGLSTVLDVIIKHGYSRIPVRGEEVDEIVGVVYAKDVLHQLHRARKKRELPDIMRKAEFVPESKKVSELLRDMQRDKFHLALVVDEYGSLSGLVTLEDLLEEIVGEIEDEYDREEPKVEPAGEDRLRVNGRLPVDELNELLDVELPNTEWDTVGGLVMGILGRVPGKGEEVEFEGLRFTAERVQGRRIAKILIARLPEEPREATAD